jgi:hypothetical protein
VIALDMLQARRSKVQETAEETEVGTAEEAIVIRPPAGGGL